MTGHDHINGHDVCVVESAQLEKAHYSLHFDVDSGLLLRIGYYWDIEEYREVDGVLFPHKIVTSRKGGSSTYIFDEVKQNQPLPDSLFAMPEASGE